MFGLFLPFISEASIPIPLLLGHGHLVTSRASDSIFYALTLCALQIVFTITITILGDPEARPLTYSADATNSNGNVVTETPYHTPSIPLRLSESVNP